MNYYELLGVPPTANLDEIRDACQSKKVALANAAEHGDSSALEQLTSLDEAFATLIDQEQRKQYNISLAPNRPRPNAHTGTVEPDSTEEKIESASSNRQIDLDKLHDKLFSGARIPKWLENPEGCDTVFAQRLGLIASGGLMACVFAPFVFVPLGGSLNYFRNGQGDGVLVLLIGLISAVFALSRRTRYLIWSGSISGILLFASWLHLLSKIKEIETDAKATFKGNIFEGLAGAFAHAIEL